MHDNSHNSFPRSITRQDALQLLKDNIVPVPETDVSVVNCSNHIAARNINSGKSLPEHDRSAMDGFAVSSTDTAGASAEYPVHMPFCGEIRPSATIRCDSAERCATRVLTGGIIPEGKDAVIPFERIIVKGDTIEIRTPAVHGDYIRSAGSDIMENELIVTANTPISPCDAALLAYAGIRFVPVRRPLSIGVLAVGNELCDPALENLCGLIPADNLILLKSLCGNCGIDNVGIATCANSPEAIADAIRENSACDLIITTGGTGPGNRDFVFNSVLEAGGIPLFKGLAMHPAKSVFACRTATGLVIGLPGPPNAVNLAFHTIIRPTINCLLGMTGLSPLLKAKLKSSVNGSRGREKMRLCVLSDETGTITADPLTAEQLSPRRIMSLSNGIIVLPPDCGELEAGSMVQVLSCR